jgi:hypothetical protein
MPTTPPSANLSFLPWVRQGAAAAISTVDTLGPAQSAVADLTAGLAVNDAPALPISVRLRGPADVVGIDANQIVRMDPRPGSSDFEPNYFPCIELDRADFPWLFTPARAEANARLRPWLCLIVVRKQDGVTLGSAPDSPLATLLIASPANPAAELPDLLESWAWVHAQAAAPDNGAVSVGAALGGAPQLSLSRLLCPRLLAPSTDYIACLVPTFELGRRIALGLPVTDADLTAANALAPAWSLQSGPPTQVLLPLLHHWEFRTGVGGDFESLARKLKPQPVPAELGQRPLDISTPGFALPVATVPGTTLGLEGALEPIDRDDKAPPAWPSGTQAPFQTALAAIVNAPGQSAVIDPQADPILAPPLYGRWYAARAIVAPGGAAWLDQLNLDPRTRAVAAFGTRVVQEHQEALMSAAWEQAAQLQQANQRVRQLQLSLAVGTRLLARHFAPLAPDRALRLTAPAFGRIRSVAGSESASRTLVSRIAGTALPLPATSVAMRIVGRAQGPLTRRVAALGFTRTASTSWIGTLSLGQGAFLATPVFDLATVSAIIQSRPSGSAAVLGYGQVTAAVVSAAASRPQFQIVAEGQPVTIAALPPQHVPDNPTTRNFRAAASEHLQRIDPGRLGILFGPPPSLAMNTVRDTVIARMQPRVALVALARATITTTGASATAPVDTPASATLGIDTVMAAPTFAQPMYEPLRDLSQQLLLPGIETVPADAVLGLKTNRRFVESYLVGLNVEMSSEMLWRGFPTDQRGTCFAQFWDVSAAPAARPDIAPLHLWKERPLGDPATAPAREQFVMLMRSALLRRYPNAVIYATPARVTSGVRAPSADPDAEVQPAFHGTLQPDISFFGFDFSTDAATGADGSAGYYIVIQEHPTEPRFGLDDGTRVATGASHLALGSGPPEGLSVAPPLEWGRNSAHMAGITRQLPVRIAIHASQFVAKKP